MFVCAPIKANQINNLQQHAVVNIIDVTTRISSSSAIIINSRSSINQVESVAKPIFNRKEIESSAMCALSTPFL